MRYFDFTRHWAAFSKHWYSDACQNLLASLLEEHGFLNDKMWRPHMPLSVLNDDAPSRTLDLESLVLPHGCHVYAPVLHRIAKLMYPMQTWIVIDGNNHSTVVSDMPATIFDLLCYYYHIYTDKGYDARAVYEMCVGARKGPLHNTRFTLYL